MFAASGVSLLKHPAWKRFRTCISFRKLYNSTLWSLHFIAVRQYTASIFLGVPASVSHTGVLPRSSAFQLHSSF